ncbi:long-chain fatty acid--CoA ligase [Candidatus Acetothermia bacterium]|nr:long-chain fatty acid--CoA ligase [Candidatus Acetothermia bacterium]MBI3642751.1 long-chain fatty acid--CoA ligase [Candidatus Acetothermia bacterium]
MLDLRNTLRRPVRMYPHAIATQCRDHEQTYSELHERVMRLANGLLSLGLQRGDRIAVLMLNCHRFLELYYAAMFAGLVIVPLNIRWGRQEFAFALSDCLPKIFALDQTIYEHFKAHFETLKMLGVQHILFADRDAPANTICYEKLLRDSSKQDPNIEVSENDLIGIFYTSGTTSHPKGVMLTHKNLMMNAYHAQLSFRFYRDNTYLHAAPMFHLADGAATFTVTWNGGTHIFVPRFEPDDVLRTIEEKRVNAVTLIPTMINWLINHPARSQYNTRSLDQILYGAAPMPPDRLKQAAEIFQCKFQQGYGMTEAAPLVTCLSAEDHERALHEGRNDLLISAGKPIIGVDVRVIHEDGRDVGVGEVGEILVRGPNIMKGYWNLPEETERALQNGWYHTKDMARVDEEGYHYVVDRKDDMIKTGGENVFSSEVESALYEHPAVLEAAIIGIPDAEWTQAIQAVVVRRGDVEITEAELIRFCKERLTHYKVPKHVVFLDELPKGGTGKILKNRLRETLIKSTQ